MLFLGRVPETHLKSLQAWPFIFFNDVHESKLDYEIETTDKEKPTTFQYDLTLKLESNDHLDKRYKGLERAVRDLFWKEATIKVLINGKEVYKSE
jgi:hypothetical protein